MLFWASSLERRSQWGSWDLSLQYKKSQNLPPPAWLSPAGVPSTGMPRIWTLGLRCFPSSVIPFPAHGHWPQDVSKFQHVGPDVTESFKVHLLLPKIARETKPGVQELGPQLCRLSLSSDNKNTALGAHHAAQGYSILSWHAQDTRSHTQQRKTIKWEWHSDLFKTGSH